MMYDDDIVTPFAVSTKEYTVETDEDIRRCYFVEENDDDGVPQKVAVGLSKSIKEPVMLPHFHIKKPNRELVMGLKIYKEETEKTGKYKRVTAPAVIARLKAEGLWNHEIDRNNEKMVKNEKSSNAVYFHREYIERWLKHQWIERDDSGKGYRVTDEGTRVIETFYVETRPEANRWTNTER